MAKRELPSAAEMSLEINPLRLHVDWMEQPAKANAVGKDYAAARLAAKEAKAAYELTVAETASDIRSDPVKYDLAKVTEDAIKAATIQQKEVKQAQQNMFDAEYLEDVLKVAVNAWNQRKDALSDLVKLHGQMYFSVPTASEENLRKMADELDVGLRRPKRATK